MKIRVPFLAVAVLAGAAAFAYSPVEAPAFSCSLCDSELMDESEYCSIGSSVIKHTFYGTEGGGSTTTVRTTTGNAATASTTTASVERARRRPSMT